MLAGPGHRHAPDAVLRAVDPRHSGLQDGLKLHGVQMAPGPFGPLIIEAAGGGALRARQRQPAAGGQANGHPLIR